MNDTSTARISSCGVVAPISAISVAHPVERLDGDGQFGRRLRRRHIVVDEPAQLVLDLGLRRTLGVPQRPVDELVRLAQLIGGKYLRGSDIRQRRGRVLAGQVAVDERADHVVVRHACQIARRVQPGNRGAGVFVDPHPGRGMPTAQADFGDVHLDVVGAVVVAAVGVERSPGGPLGGVQDVLQRGQRLVRQVRHLQIDRPAGRFDLALHLGHHLARPVVGVDEPFAERIDLVAAERVGHVGARRARCNP